MHLASGSIVVGALLGAVGVDEQLPAIAVRLEVMNPTERAASRSISWSRSKACSVRAVRLPSIVVTCDRSISPAAHAFSTVGRSRSARPWRSRWRATPIGMRCFHASHAAAVLAPDGRHSPSVSQRASTRASATSSAPRSSWSRSTAVGEVFADQRVEVERGQAVERVGRCSRSAVEDPRLLVGCGHRSSFGTAHRTGESGRVRGLSCRGPQPRSRRDAHTVSNWCSQRKPPPGLSRRPEPAQIAVGRLALRPPPTVPDPDEGWHQG